MTEEAGRPGRRQRSLHCKPAEQAMIRERAAAAGKTVSRQVGEKPGPYPVPVVGLLHGAWGCPDHCSNCGRPAGVPSIVARPRIAALSSCSW